MMEGKPAPIDKSQVQQLEAIGFVWDSHKDSWETKFAMLVEFHAKNGHCRVPRDCAKNPKLSSWVKRQRRSYKAGQMYPSRISRMEKLGFVWDPRGIHGKLSKGK